VKIDKFFDSYDPTTFVSESVALEAAGPLCTRSVAIWMTIAINDQAVALSPLVP